MPQLALVAGYIVVVLVGLLGLIVAWNIFTGRIDLRYLISEKDGPASMSRFQFLIFTFAIAMCLVVLTLESGEFPKLDPNILGLLGISGGSYLVSKGITNSSDQAKAAKTPPAHGKE
jgi:hypothetical protein